MLPHFGYAERSGLRYFRSIEYRPPKNRKWTRDDIVFLFNGYYAVVHYRVFHVSRHATMAEALKAYYFGER